MIDNGKKVDKFIEAITAYAQEQSRKIHDEVEAFKTERLAQAEQQVLQESYVLIHQEREDENNRLKKELSQRDFARRGELIRRRQAITGEVFDEARQKLQTYNATPAYLRQLRDSLTEMRTMLPAEDTVYFLTERDRALQEQLADLCPAGSRFEYTADIALGGVRGENQSAGILVDDTLDVKLEQQEEWFVQTIGLTVKPV